MLPDVVPGGPFFQGFGIFKHVGILTPAGNRLHLGMGGNADDDGGSPLFLGLGDDFVDALDIGAARRRQVFRSEKLSHGKTSRHASSARPPAGSPSH